MVLVEPASLASRISAELAEAGVAPAAVQASLLRRVDVVRQGRRRPYTGLASELAAVPVPGRADDNNIMGQQNRLLAVTLAAQYSAAGCPVALPAEVAALFARQRQRVLQTLADREDPSFYALTNDDFLKEMAIVSHRLIPHGRGFADPWSRVSARILVAGGPAQAVRAVRLLMAETRGLGPFLGLHLHTLDLPDRDDPHGWVETHRTIAGILALNPGIRGESGGGWLYDPRVTTVSPRQAFRRQVVVDGGAIPFFLQRDSAGTSGALTTSKTRRDLFERGEYVPEIWVCVWPRKKLLAWAARTASVADGSVD